MRINYYAAKIKELGYDPRAPFGMDELPVPRKVAVTIEFANNPCIVRLPFELVPNVKRLRWTSWECESSMRTYLNIFLNPPLTSLVLDFRNAPLNPVEWCTDATIIKCTLKAVAPQCPAFRNLEVLWTPHEGLGGRGVGLYEG